MSYIGKRRPMQPKHPEEHREHKSKYHSLRHLNKPAIGEVRTVQIKGMPGFVFQKGRKVYQDGIIYVLLKQVTLSESGMADVQCSVYGAY